MSEEQNGDGQGPSTRGSSTTIAPLHFGVMAGALGFLVGGTSGILRSTRAGASAAVTGITWFGMGTGYSYLRRGLIPVLRQQSVSRDTIGERRQASSLAGGIVGLARGAAQSRRHVIPGAIMFSIFGYTGQRLYDLLDTSESQSQPTSLLGRIANQSWTPVSVLSDREYKKILDDRIFKLDVDIALIDDRIARLQHHARQQDNETIAPVRS